LTKGTKIADILKVGDEMSQLKNRGIKIMDFKKQGDKNYILATLFNTD